MQSVRDWMIDLLVFVDPENTITEALSLMRKRYIHSVLVNKSPENSDFGILTSTDISDKIIAAGRNPNLVRVSEIMTSPVITAHKDWSLQQCAQVMKEHHIHHVPVADENGELVGMISATDFMVAAEALGRDVTARTD
ncbi:MAG: CBS domain-containing protein [Chloroflexi bacterium]|nr:CBS domain-containing protein [Chloroflexota bacterium]